MKRIIAAALASALLLSGSAFADRKADSRQYTSSEKFRKAVQMGTLVTIETDYKAPYMNSEINALNFCGSVYMPGCQQTPVYVILSQEQADTYQTGDHLLITAPMNYAGTTGKAIYIDARKDTANIEAIPQRAQNTLDMDSNQFNINDYYIGDIVTGTSGTVAQIDKDSMFGKTRYYTFVKYKAGVVVIRSSEKEYFVNDVLDITSIIDGTNKHGYIFVDSEDTTITIK